MRDTRVNVLCNYVKTLNGWDNFVCYLYTNEAVETGILGGRTRYRHITQDDLKYLTEEENTTKPENLTTFSEVPYWALPIQDL